MSHVADDSVKGAPSGVSFQGTNVAAKDVMSIDGILAVDWEIRNGIPVDVTQKILEFRTSD